MSADRLFQDPAGKSALVSSFISAVFLILIFLLPLAPYNPDAWYSGLYLDIELPDDDRFNWWLVVFEWLFLFLFLFFSSTALGNMAEFRNTLPGWKEILFPAGATVLLAIFVPKIGITGGIVGSTEDRGFYHFTPDMQSYVLWVSIFLIIIFLYYVVSISRSLNTD